MTELVQEMCWGMMLGFRDAILGCFKVFKMDQNTQSQNEKQSDEPMTTLAKRRAEKQKQFKKATVKSK